MINIFCDKCNEKGKLRISGEKESVLIECLNCGVAKRIVSEAGGQSNG